jgi:TolB-like protein/Tfp pilus assembly protein PilF
LPVELDHILDKALAKNTDERYQHIEDMLVDLRALSLSVQTGGGATIARRKRSRYKKTTTLRVAAIATATVVLAGVGFYTARLPLREAPAGGAAPQEASVVVLPLDNLSDHPEQEYFSDGMTEALISDLGKIAALKVISRHSAMRYKDSPMPLPQIARDLGVSHVVVGSVTQAEGQVRIAAQLVDAATDRQLWSDSFVRERRDILVLQAQVARTIAEQIRVQLSPQEQARLSRAAAVNPEAYEAYLKGKFYAVRFSPADADTALEYYHLALERDPKFARAYAGIALIWVQRQTMGVMSAKEAGPRAAAALTKALELDSTDEEVQFASAMVSSWVQWDWAGSEAGFQRVLETNASHAGAHAAYGRGVLTLLGRQQEAMAHTERAIELDPHNPLFQGIYCQDLIFAGRYDDAIGQCRKVLETAPNSLVAHTGLHAAFHEKGMDKEALEHWKSKLAIQGQGEAVEALHRGYTEGSYQRALALAAETLATGSRTAHVSPFEIASLYADAGNKDQTFDWLEKAVEARAANTPWIHVIPHFAFLRNEPRFRDLLRRMNIPLE